MLSWFAETLKQYPEIAIFLALGFGYYFGKFTFRGLGLGSVTATLLAGVADRTDRDYDRAAPQGDGLSHVSVCRGLRRWAAVRPRYRQGWRAASHLRGGAMRVLPGRPVR